MMKIIMLWLIGPLMAQGLRPLTADESADLPRWMVILDQIAWCFYGILPTTIILGTIALFAIDDFFKWLHGVCGC